MFYEKNIIKMSKNEQNEINKVEIPENIEIVDTKIAGMKTIKVKISDRQEIFLHSKYNPEEEAERFIEQYDITEKRNIVVAGFGAGYHIRKLLSKMENWQNLYVIEINPGILKSVLEISDFSDIFNDSRFKIVFSINKKELAEKILNILDENCDDDSIMIIHYPSLKAASPDLSDIRDIFEKIDIYKKSHERFKNTIHENIKNNMNCIIEDTPFFQIVDLYKNRPIFLVSAGPSLDKNIEELKNVKDRGIIISVGTTFKRLINIGIIPDFVIIIDGLDNIYRQFDGYFDHKIPLVYIPGANSQTVTIYQGLRIVAFPDGDTIYDKMEQILHKGIIKSGGSVATAALDIAKQMGGSPIIFVGQDLALSKDGKTHGTGTWKEEYKNKIQSLREIEGIDGGKVFTLKNLYVYLKWIEQYIEEHGDRLFINATEGGAFIKGTIVMKLKEVVDKYCTREIDKSFIKTVKRKRIESREEIKKEIDKILEEAR